MSSELSVQKLREALQHFDELGSYNHLLTTANQLLQKDPNNAEYVLYKLKAMEGLGIVTSDLKLLQHYVNIRSTDVSSFLLLYKAYVELDNIAEALISLVFALSIAPDDEECQQLLTNLLADVDPKYTHVKINTLTINRIGHLACEIEPWARNQQEKDDTCLHLFLSSGGQAANPYLYELLKNVAHIVETPFFYQLYHSRPLLLTDKFYGKMPYDLSLSLRGVENAKISHEGFINLIDIYQKNPPCLRIPEGDSSFGWQYLDKLGVKPEDKIVLLHVRDSAYLDSKFPKNDFSYHDFRDANIASYKPCIEHLLTLGYKVIRIGSDTNQSIDMDNPNYIDLCINRDEEHGDFFEVFLMSLCDFFIANFSGPYGVAALFDTPTLVVNGTPIQHPYMKFGRFIPKLLLKNGEPVNMIKVCQGKEVIDATGKAVVSSFNEKEFSAQGFSYQDNTPEDILNAVIEFEKTVMDKLYKAPLTNLQQSYYDALPESFCHQRSKNVISHSFLEKHSALFTVPTSIIGTK